MCMQMPNAREDDKYQIRDCFIGNMRENGKRDYIISVDLLLVDFKLGELLEVPKAS